MKRILTFVALQLAWSICAAKTFLVDKIPFCEDRPYVFYDMDGDGRAETICTRSKGEKHQNGNVYGIFINFTKHQKSYEFLTSLLTDAKLPVYAHDDYIETVDLSRYKHPRLKKRLSGVGLRLVHPEKSTVIYYWDKKKNEVAEFWESD